MVPKRTRTDHTETKVEAGSGDIFSDIGIDLTPEEALKVELARRISREVLARELTQAAVGEILAVDQAKVSNLLRGRLAGFSVERLSRYLRTLGWDVRVSFRQRQGAPGRVVIDDDEWREHA